MLYAHSGPVLRKQLLADLALLLWCITFGLLGHGVYRLVNQLRGPADSLGNAANSLGDRVDSANSRLPGFLQGALDGIGGGTDSVGNAASQQADAVTHVASVLGWSVALVPITIAVIIALYFRVRWMRRVKSATAYRHLDEWQELLARRAVMHQPLGELRKISDNPLYDLEAGRYERLAALELRELGIDPSRSTAPTRR